MVNAHPSIHEADPDNPSHVAAIASIFLSTPDPLHIYRAPHRVLYPGSERDYVTANYKNYLWDPAYIAHLCQDPADDEPAAYAI